MLERILSRCQAASARRKVNCSSYSPVKKIIDVKLCHLKRRCPVRVGEDGLPEAVQRDESPEGGRRRLDLDNVAAGPVRENRENEISIHHFIGRRLLHGLF